MDNETREVLTVIVNDLITISDNAFYAHEMAHSLYRTMKKENPLQFQEEFQKASLGLDELIRARCETKQSLSDILRKLKEIQE